MLPIANPGDYLQYGSGEVYRIVNFPLINGEPGVQIDDETALFFHDRFMPMRKLERFVGKGIWRIIPKTEGDLLMERKPVGKVHKLTSKGLKKGTKPVIRNGRHRFACGVQEIKPQAPRRASLRWDGVTCQKCLKEKEVKDGRTKSRPAASKSRRAGREKRRG